MPASYTDTAISVLKYATATVGVLVLGAGGLLYAYQESLIYPAHMPSGSRTHVPTPDEFGMPFEDLTLVTPDGIRIRAYLMQLAEIEKLETVERRPTVLLLHANAGNHGHRLPIAKVFVRKMRCNVMTLSYRGYGLSEGKANEAGLRLDAQTALDYLLSHPALSDTDIYVYGQSIGGAVAIDLTSRNVNRVKGLIIENTFLSLPKLVPHVLPPLSPFLFLLHQKWPSEERISLLGTDFPVLFLSGAQDELVPSYMMKELFRIGGGEKDGGVKEWKEFAEGTHNDTCLQAGYFAAIQSFIRTHSSLPSFPSFSSFSSFSSPSPVKPSATFEKPSATSDTESFEFVEKEGDDEWKGLKEAGEGSRVDVGENVREKMKEKVEKGKDKIEKL